MMGFIGGGIIGGRPPGYFSLSEYTGNGTSQSIVTRQNLSGDGGMVMVRNIDTITSLGVFDTARGATEAIYANSTAAEQSIAGTITGFNGSGFEVGSHADVNQNGSSILALSWIKKAGYFDIVTWTGNGASAQSIAHSLGVTPAMIWVKKTSGIDSWGVRHSSFSNNLKYLNLDSAAAISAAAGYWNNAAPSSHSFSVGAQFNSAGESYIAYLFADQIGRCKFGNYAGTGGANNAIALGFSPKAVLVKCTSDAADWILFYQSASGDLYEINPNGSAVAELYNSAVSLSATGFTWLDGSPNRNGVGRTYIYAAWAW